MAFPLVPLIGAASSLIGGLLGNKAASDAAEEQADLQKKFAQNAIQWKVADAKKAGVHPLYALGANTVSYSPVSVGDGGLGSAFADMGQNIGRAVEAVQSAPEREMQKRLSMLQLERAGLENEFLKTQIAGQVNTNVRNAQVGPAMPEVIVPPQRTPNVNVAGKPVVLDPGTSNLGQLSEDRYGEGPASWPAGFVSLWQDIQHNMKDMSVLDVLRAIDRYTSVNKYGYK